MNVQKTAALILGKVIVQTTRILKTGGGSAAPGYYALKLYPDLVKDLARQIPKTIVITGTNGKTTTARMVAHFAKEAGFKVIKNATGSNLERGIASALISGPQNADLAIWELDEAAFNNVIPKIKPDVIVFLNVFRDQLDRYGEVDSVVKRWCHTLSKVDPGTKVFINGDDQSLYQLMNFFPGQVQTFGLKDSKIAGEKVMHDTKAISLDLEAQKIEHREFDSTETTIRSGKSLVKFSIPMPGTYNIYNFLAAYACGKILGISDQLISKSLNDFSPAFGRVEKFIGKGGREGYIFLIKNPTGTTQVLRTLTGELKTEDRLLLALNDNLADGTDVSWIWDADFELIQNLHLREPEGSSEPRTARAKSRGFNIICSGTRAEDLALRLKYAGFDPKSLTIENDLQRAFHASSEGLKGRLVVLPTYTAMLRLQSILTKSGIKKHYWKE